MKASSLQLFIVAYFLLSTLDAQLTLEYAFQSQTVTLPNTEIVGDYYLAYGSDGDCAGAKVYCFSEKKRLEWSYTVPNLNYTIPGDIKKLNDSLFLITGRSQLADDVPANVNYFIELLDIHGNLLASNIIDPQILHYAIPSLYCDTTGALYLILEKTIYSISILGPNIFLNEIYSTQSFISKIISFNETEIYYVSDKSIIHENKLRIPTILVTSKSKMINVIWDTAALYVLTNGYPSDSIFKFDIVLNQLQYIDTEKSGIKRIYDIVQYQGDIFALGQNSSGKGTIVNITGRSLNKVITANYESSSFLTGIGHADKLFLVGNQSYLVPTLSISYPFVKLIQDFKWQDSTSLDIQLSINRLNVENIDSIRLSDGSYLYARSGEIEYTCFNSGKEEIFSSAVQSHIYAFYNCQRESYDFPITNRISVGQSQHFNDAIGKQGYFKSKNFSILMCAFAPNNYIDPVPNNNCAFKTVTKVLDQNTKSQITVTPNPAFEYIEIHQITNPNVLNFEILNAQGLRVRIGNLMTDRKIGISNLISGYYFLKITNQNDQLISNSAFIKL